MIKSLAADPGFTQTQVAPKPGGLPGTTTALGFVQGIVFYMLLLTVVGVVLSAGLWAVGSFSNNYTQSINGKKGFLICIAAALAIGSAYVIMQYFFTQGQTLSGTTGGK